MGESTRRRFLRLSGIAGVLGMTGCSQFTGSSDIRDSDGDGVIDSEDYAPRDASVQRAKQVREVNSTRQTNAEPATDRQTEARSGSNDPAGAETSGPSGLRVFDNFERRSNLEWTVKRGNTSALVFSNNAIRGSRCLHFKNDPVSIKLTKPFKSPTQISEFSLWFKYQSREDNNFRFKLRDVNNDRLVEIREYSQTVHYKNERTPGVLSNPIADISQGSWYRVILSAVDFESRTLDISVENRSGRTVGSVTGLDFWEEVNEVQNMRLVNGLEAEPGPGAATDPLWLDNIVYRV